MDKKIPELKTRLYLGSIIILAAGLCGALLIYLTAADASDSAEAYVMVNGVAYPVDLTHSKVYVHQLRLFGGKAAVLFDDFNRWFAGLWRGKSLATTVAWTSFFVSLGVVLFARLLPSSPDPDDRIEDDRHGPDR